MDVVQVGHPSFYPVKVLEHPAGYTYVDAFKRTHVIAGYYDEFCAPFPLRRGGGRVDPAEIARAWETYTLPDPRDPAWFAGLEAVVAANDALDDPLSVWGVINGPFEPSWQLVSDGWVDLFTLARKDPDLAGSILERVTAYCIEAGAAMIDRGVDAIRTGDDYALNEGLMCKPGTWHDLIFPWHAALVRGLKAAGGQDFPVILHSDGDITLILPWLVEGGIDALNPIQPGALDMARVVAACGDRLAMTGAFDLRYFLDPCVPATRDAMAAEVARLFDIIDAFNDKGPGRTGFCIGPSHQVQPTSHVDTFEAWVATVHAANDRRSR